MKMILTGVAALLLVACNQAPEHAVPEPPIDESTMNNVWHQAKLRGVAFRAIGQEPGWLLEITNGEEILLVTNYGSARTIMPYVEPVVYHEERRTQYVIDDYNTIVEIRGKRCTDTMSGEELEVTVTISQTDKVLHGCGRALF